MKILVAGGSGFIGRNLIDSFKGKWEVDNVSLRNTISEEQYKHAEVFVNLVGKAHDFKGTATEEEYFFVNNQLAQDLFALFLKSEATLFIHISSLAAVEEFGSDSEIEEGAECNPVSLYGRSKRAAEVFLNNQQLPEGKRVVILRPTMVHGAGDKGNLTLLYKLVKKGIPYPLSKFDNKRSFLSIENFNFLLHHIIEKRQLLKTGTFNICDDQPVSTNEVISIIGEVLGKRIKRFAIPKNIIYVLASIGDRISLPLNSKRLKKMTSDLVVSNQKIKSVLGVATLPLTAKEGLRKTFISFK